MDWQQIASLSIVAVTTVLLARYQLRRRQRGRIRACGNACGCSSTHALEELKEQLQPGFTEKIVSTK